MKIAIPMEEAGPDGVLTLTFPDNGGGSGYNSFVRHLQGLARLDETQLQEMLSTAKGAEQFGSAELGGVEDPWDLLEEAGAAPEANLGPLSDDEYTIFLQGGDPQRPRKRVRRGSTVQLPEEDEHQQHQTPHLKYHGE